MIQGGERFAGRGSAPATARVCAGKDNGAGSTERGESLSPRVRPVCHSRVNGNPAPPPDREADLSPRYSPAQPPSTPPAGGGKDNEYFSGLASVLNSPAGGGAARFVSAVSAVGEWG